jgi:tetratricopeptide (TPR) repeat protein
MENNNNKLIPVTNSLISIEKQLTIGDKIINKKIEELFNKAFKLINSKNIDVNSNHNYLADFLKDESLLHSEKFLFLVQNKKDYEYALEIFDKIIQIDCNFKFAYYLKGIVFQKLILVQESINSFSKALQIDNQFVSALIERIKLFEIYNSELALNDCNKLISIQPDNSEYYLTRANILFSLEEIKESINDYLISIRLEPNNISAYNNLGRTYLNIEEVELANTNFFKAIEIAEEHLVKQPYNYKLYYYIAYAEYQLEKYNKALLSIDKSIEIENDYANAYVLRSRLYNIFSKYKESIDDSLKYLESNPLDFSEYNFLGLIYEKVKDYKKAEECYTKSIEMNIYKCNPEYYRAHLFRSSVRKILGDLNGSKEDYEIYKQFKKIL